MHGHSVTLTLLRVNNQDCAIILHPEFFLRRQRSRGRIRPLSRLVQQRREAASVILAAFPQHSQMFTVFTQCKEQQRSMFSEPSYAKLGKVLWKHEELLTILGKKWFLINIPVPKMTLYFSCKPTGTRNNFPQGPVESCRSTSIYEDSLTCWPKKKAGSLKATLLRKVCEKYLAHSHCCSTRPGQKPSSSQPLRLSVT